jgi:hypothetical protein
MRRLLSFNLEGIVFDLCTAAMFKPCSAKSFLLYIASRALQVFQRRVPSSFLVLDVEGREFLIIAFRELCELVPGLAGFVPVVFFELA